MGLLDDAIREHLELKRLRGADPGAVAREEKAALGRPVSREGQVAGAGRDDDEDQLLPDIEVSFPADPEPSTAEDPVAPGQETIEINMEAELAAGAHTTHEPGQEPMQPTRAVPAAHSARVQASREDSLEWEAPSDRLKERVGETGVDTEASPRVEDDREAAEQVRDVLEKTPDFLRDTPEQDRLWFEQRPPRDFDFNE